MHVCSILSNLSLLSSNEVKSKWDPHLPLPYKICKPTSSYCLQRTPMNSNPSTTLPTTHESPSMHFSSSISFIKSQFTSIAWMVAQLAHECWSAAFNQRTHSTRQLFVWTVAVTDFLTDLLFYLTNFIVIDYSNYWSQLSK